MKVTLKLARVGMSMQEATIDKWFKQPGDGFEAGEALYSIETDKVTQEIEATTSGTLLEVFVAEGQDVSVGAPICVVDLKG